ncbi:MarR family winged helix-turn-helix transcriptional regulator [Methanobrevibacter sp. OttesenSCG-928-I08]|nr:MarR family winged helix-turn-helix transcriptional regulator [Methanobrevibacter sp. OttesenSCG-928-I08]
MLFNENIDENEFSTVNFLEITNKAYMLYLNQKIEDLHLSIEHIPFIMELEKNQNISKKDLINYIFENGKSAVKSLVELYYFGIIKKSEKEDVSDKYDDINISLTEYGEKLALKINEINKEWETLIYTNLESSDKEKLMKNISEIAISSLKINENIENIDETNASKAKKFINKFINKLFSKDFHNRKRKSNNSYRRKGNHPDFDIYTFHKMRCFGDNFDEMREISRFHRCDNSDIEKIPGFHNYGDQNKDHMPNFPKYPKPGFDKMKKMPNFQKCNNQNEDTSKDELDYEIEKSLEYIEIFEGLYDFER